MTPTLPLRMRGWVSPAYGKKQHLQVHHDLPVPTLHADELLIQVRGVSVNPVDLTLVAGGLQRLIHKPLPFVVGTDLSGVIVAVGSQCDRRWQIGDAVMACNWHDVQGSHSEYVALPASRVVRAPEGIPLVNAAAIPMAGLTALQGLAKHGQVKKGSRVLILGAASGVGTFAVQIARLLGASRVYATCNSRDVKLVKSLGANVVIPDDTQQWAALLKGRHMDVIFDSTFGRQSWTDSQQILAPEGVYVTSVGDNINCHGHAQIKCALESAVHSISRKAHSLFHHNPQHITFFPSMSNSDLTRLAFWVDQGRLQVVIDKSYSFQEVPLMWAAAASSRARGKLVATITGPLNSNPLAYHLDNTN